MRVAILGFGQQGLSAYKYYSNLGATITVCDQNEHLTNLPDKIPTKLGADYLKDLKTFDLIVRTPFLKPKLIIQANPNSPSILKKVTTASNEFFRVVKTPIIAITGTKGKGTTCLIAQEILKQAGLKTVLMGNIGVPPLDVVEESQKADVVIFEIASFQTLDLQYSPSVGVCLNMTPEHLDWHDDYQDYLKSKAQLFAHQTSVDKAIYAAGDLDSKFVVKNSSAQILSYSGCDDKKADVYIKDKNIYVLKQKVGSVDDIKLLGQHNKQNVCAAITAVYDFLPKEKASTIITKALKNCQGFPSRLQTVRYLHNVRYIDDSYASAPEASIAALKAIVGPKILIAGGHDKGVDMQPFAQAILDYHVKYLITIGQTGQKIARLILKQKPTFKINQTCQNMEQIILVAQANARAGDTVLLSTGSASFGMFKNYHDRASQFQKAVRQLK